MDSLILSTRIHKRMIRAMAATIALAAASLPAIAQGSGADGSNPQEPRRRLNQPNQEGQPGGRDGRRFERGQRGEGFGPGQGRRGEGMGGFGGGGIAGLGGNLGQLLQPKYLRRDLPIFVQELQLDDAQRTVVEQLIQDYTDAFAVAAEELRGDLPQLRPQMEDDPEKEQQREQLRGEMEQLQSMVRELRAGAEAAAAESGTERAQISEEDATKLREQFTAMREKMQALRPTPLSGEMDRVRDAIGSVSAKWKATRDALERDLLQSTQAVLTPGQIETWPGFEQTLRREKTLRQGRLSGENVNLFDVLREASAAPSESAELRKALDAYATELDQALAARNDHVETSLANTAQAMIDRDFDKLAASSRRETQLRIAVRNVNGRYAETVAGVLDAERADGFRHAYLRRAYGRIYRSTSTQQAFAAALRFDDLTADSSAAIEALQIEYLATLEPMNAALVDLMREQEETQGEERLARMQAAFAGDQAQRPQRGSGDEREVSPLRQKFEDRSTLDQTYRGLLDALLTPEQIAELPQPPPARGEGRSGRDGAGFGGPDGARGAPGIPRAPGGSDQRGPRTPRGG